MTNTIDTADQSHDDFLSLSVQSNKLDSTNYLIWLNQIQPLLLCSGLSQYIDGTPAPSTHTLAAAESSSVTPASIPNPAYQTWHLEDQKVRTLLQSSLTPEAAAVVVGCVTSRQIWVALENTFSHMRELELKEQLQKRKRGSSKVADYASKFKVHEDKDTTDFVDDLNEPTMGEKLASLNLVEMDGGSKAEDVDASELKPPSADSVFVLLKQALRAEDQALLTDCLFRKDEKVIANSLSLLTPSDVLKFLRSLVSIIQLRGAVLASALPWLRSLLLQHASIIMSQESSLAALNTLYQLIESRVSTSDQALQLSSSLDLIYSETLDDEENEDDAIIPVIYDDSDGSGDEGSEESMDTESVEDGGEPLAHSDISDVELDGEVSD